LLRNTDIVEIDDELKDWNFMYGKVYGFVKSTFKLTDGWSPEHAELMRSPRSEVAADEAIADGEAPAGAPPAAKAADAPVAADAMKAAAGVGSLTEEKKPNGKKDEKEIISVATEQDVRKLTTSFGFDEKLDSYAFDVAKLTKRYKAKERVPSRVRVRIYFVKALCIFGKQVEGFFAKAFIDPYLAYKLGTAIIVSMRNMAQFNTNVPSFYRVEERDILMPSEARLQVDLFDYQDAMGESINGEKLIGSTVIDLEDRWHSDTWRDSMDKRQQVPTENRPLINPKLSGQNCGNIEMWVELLDSVRASDIKASELRKPPAIEVEVRLVIRTLKNIKLFDGTKTDAKITVDLECKEYEGKAMGFPQLQATDVHYGSTGPAVYNWRIVYPRIVMPTKSCTMDMKLYQANSITADDFIGSVSVDLRRYVERVARDMDAIYIEKADLTFSAGQQEEGEGEDDAAAADDNNVGSVQFEMWFMTQSEADQKRAGKGREDPNDYPQLVTPSEGRGWGDFLSGFSFSLPDFGLMKKLLPVIILVLLALVVLRQIGLL